MKHEFINFFCVGRLYKSFVYSATTWSGIRDSRKSCSQRKAELLCFGSMINVYVFGINDQLPRYGAALEIRKRAAREKAELLWLGSMIKILLNQL